AVLHDQRRWNGHGAGDLPLHRRIASRAALGGEERTAGGEVRLHLAGRAGNDAMTEHDHIVFVIDDDIRIQEAVEELLASHEIHAVVFGSAGDYVDAEKPDIPSCLFLDVELPDISGLDLQRQIAEG